MFRHSRNSLWFWNPKFHCHTLSAYHWNVLSHLLCSSHRSRIVSAILFSIFIQSELWSPVWSLSSWISNENFVSISHFLLSEMESKEPQVSDKVYKIIILPVILWEQGGDANIEHKKKVIAGWKRFIMRVIIIVLSYRRLWLTGLLLLLHIHEVPGSDHPSPSRARTHTHTHTHTHTPTHPPTPFQD
jgi:hypothetical protein